MDPHALLDAAQAAFEAGRIRDAEALLDAREAVLGRSAIEETDGRWGAGWALRAELLRRQGRLEEGAALAARLVALSSRHGWGREAWARTVLASCELGRERWQHAEELLQAALAQHRRDGEPLGEAIALRWVADLEQRRGDLEAAGRCLADAFAAADRAGDAFARAATSLRMGRLEVERGASDRASGWFQRAAEAFRQLDNPVGEATALLERGRALSDRGEAEALVGRARELFAAREEQAGAARATLALASLAWQAGELRTAEAYGREVERMPGLDASLVQEAALVAMRVALGRGLHEQARARAEAVLADGEAAPRARLVAHGGALVVEAEDRRWAAWEEQLEAIRSLLSVHGGADETLAWCARRAGAACAGGRAARCLALALDQLHQLGRRDEAEAVHAALAALAASGTPLPLGAFDLSHPIGEGGMGQVWQGTHRASGLPVAVKVITARAARQEEARTLFASEVRAVAALDHPRIVRVLDHGTLDAAAEAMSEGILRKGSPYLVMELVEGGALERRCGNLDWPAIRSVLLALLEALAHAHAHGLVHLDIKPGNALVVDGPDGLPTVKLTDFGLAQVFDERLGRVAGTPAYMAPEQFRGEARSFGPWTDLYAVGGVAAALVQGAPPFGIGSVARLKRDHLVREPPPLRPRVPVPRALEAWIGTLLDKLPEGRFVRAADAAWALRRLPAELDPASTLPADDVEIAPEDAETFLFGDGIGSAAPDGPQRAPRAEVRRQPPPVPPSWADLRREEPRVELLDAGLGLFGLRESPVVGREAEQEALWGTLRRAAEERCCHAVLLSGGAGMGRTRLLDWLGQRAHEQGAAFVVRVCHGPNEPSGHALGEAVRRVGDAVGLDRARVREQLERMLRSVAQDADPLEPEELDVLVDLACPEEGRLTRPRDRHGAIGRMIGRMATQRPVLLLVDDVHWGADGIALAAHLMRRRRLGPLLVVMTARHDLLAEHSAEAERLERLDRLDLRRIELQPLTDEAQGRLVRDLLPLEPAVVDAIVRRTGGSPQFARLLVEDHVRRRLLVSGPRGWRLRPGAREELPGGVSALLQARVGQLLEGLPAGTRECLEIAALLGAEVDREEWRRACAIASAPRPEPLLERLLAQGAAASRAGGSRWAFTQGIVREVLVRCAEAAGRAASLHLACARMLEERGATTSRARLGRHLVAAGELEAALEPLMAGAHGEIRRSEWEAANDLLDEAEEALGALGVAEDDPRGIPLALGRAELLALRGRDEESVSFCRRAAALAEAAGRPLDAAKAWRQEALCHRVLGRWDLAEDLLRSSLEVSRAEADRAGTARSLHGLGRVARARGDLAEAEGFLRESCRLFEDDDRRVAVALVSLATVVRLRGDPVEADRIQRRALALNRASGNRHWVASALNDLAEGARHRGELDEAAEGYREALAIARAVGIGNEFVIELNLALVHLGRGDVEAAREGLRRVEAELPPTGMDDARGLVGLAVLAASAVELDEEAWRERMAEAEAFVSSGLLVDGDAVQCAEMAARRVREAGRAERVAEAEALAERVRAARSR